MSRFSLLWALFFSLLCLAPVGCGASASSAEYASSPYYGESSSSNISYKRQESLAFASSEVDGSLRNDAKPSPADEPVPGPNGPVKRKFVRSASLTVEVDDEDDFKPTLQRAIKAAEAIGGYVQQESTTSVTLMVPTERLEEVVLKLEKLGEVIQRDVRVVDVTSQYVDMQIRINNLRKMRERLTELVAQSTDVSEILKIETELGRITSELERMEGQMRLLERNTTYATIYLSLQEEVTPGPVGWVFYGAYKAVKWLFVWD